MNKEHEYLSNNQIRHIKTLNKRKFREKFYETFAEGHYLVMDLLNHYYGVKYIVVDESFVKKENEIIELASQKGIECYTVNTDTYYDLAQTTTPSGIMAIISWDLTGNIRRISKTFDKKNTKLLWLDRIQEPGNFGSIIRTSAFFGISGIIIDKGTVDYLNPKVIRSSMGAFYNIPIASKENLEIDLEFLKGTGYKIVSSSLNQESISLWEYEPDDKIVLVLGNESSGVSEDIENIADYRLKIQGNDIIDSLGVASAAAILISYITK